MDWWVKVHIGKTDDLNLIPKPKVENWLRQVVHWQAHLQTDSHRHQMIIKYKFEKPPSGFNNIYIHAILNQKRDKLGGRRGQWRWVSRMGKISWLENNSEQFIMIHKSFIHDSFIHSRFIHSFIHDLFTIHSFIHDSFIDMYSWKWCNKTHCLIYQFKS